MALSNAYLKVIKKLFNKSENDLSVIKKDDYVCPLCEHYHLGIVKYEDCEYCGMPKKYLTIKKVRDFLLTGIYPFVENNPFIFLDRTDFSFNYEALLKEINSSNFKKLLSATMVFPFHFKSSKKDISQYYNQQLATIAESRRLLIEIRKVLLTNIKKNTKYIQGLGRFRKNLSYFQQTTERFYNARIMLLSNYDIYTLEIFAMNVNRLDNYMTNNLTFSPYDEDIDFVEQWMEREITKIRNFKSFVSFSNSEKKFGSSSLLKNVNNNYLQTLDKIEYLRSLSCTKDNSRTIKNIFQDINDLVQTKKESLAKLETITSSIEVFSEKSWRNLQKDPELLALKEKEKNEKLDIEFLDTSFAECLGQIYQFIPSEDFLEVLKRDADILNDSEYKILLIEIEGLYLNTLSKKNNWHNIFTYSSLNKRYKAWLRIAKEFLPKERRTKEYILAREIRRYTKEINEHIKYFEIQKSELVEKIETLWDTFLLLKSKDFGREGEKINDYIENKIPRHRFDGVKAYLNIDEAKVVEARENLSETIKNQRIDLKELLSSLKSDAEDRFTYKRLTRDS